VAVVVLEPTLHTVDKLTVGLVVLVVVQVWLILLAVRLHQQVKDLLVVALVELNTAQVVAVLVQLVQVAMRIRHLPAAMV
jgi:hypothetical protein